VADNKVYEFFFRRTDGMMSLRKGLDAYALRQKVLASNIANSETPGYVAKRVKFEAQLAKALDKQQSGLARSSFDHLPIRNGVRAMDSVVPEVSNVTTAHDENGVNNVDIEREMTDLATNQIQYTTAAKVMSMRYQMLKSAIMGQ